MLISDSCPRLNIASTVVQTQTKATITGVLVLLPVVAQNYGQTADTNGVTMIIMVRTSKT